MLGQMALIQGLAREQEELRTMISQLHQDRSNMKQPVQVRDQVFDQLPRGQESGMVKNRPLQIATTSQAQHQPRPEQQVDQSKASSSKRQFTQLNMSLFQALQRLLRLNLITLRAHPRNQDTASPVYDPNKRCAQHSFVSCPGLAEW